MSTNTEHPRNVPCSNCEFQKCQTCTAASLYLEGFVSKPENQCSCYKSNPQNHLQNSKTLPRKPLITKQEGSSSEAIIEKPIIEVDD